MSWRLSFRRSIWAPPFEQSTLRSEGFRQKIQGGADAGRALEIIMGEQPQSRAGLRQRLRRQAAQLPGGVAQVAREQSEAQAGFRRVAQRRERVDAAGDANRAQ